MAVRFPASTLRPTGRTSRGVISMKLIEGDTIADMNVLALTTPSIHDDDITTSSSTTGEEFVFCVTEQGYGKRVSKCLPTTFVRHLGGRLGWLP